MSALRKIVSSGLLFCACFCFLSECARLRAHPFHTTTAEMEYNPESGRFEVSLKVLASDLEEALTRAIALQSRHPSPAASKPALPVAGSPNAASPKPGPAVGRVRLDGTPEVERLIRDYLKTRFFLTTLMKDDAEGTSDEMSSKRMLGADAGTESPSQEELIQARSHAAVRSSRVPASSLRWVGMELDRATAWIYFELQPPPGDKLSLVNELFIEINTQQINTCTLRTRGEKYSLRTDARQPHVALPPQARPR